MEPQFIAAVLLILLVLVLIVTAVAIVAVWNDATKRLERLKRLVADLRSVRARRRDVQSSVYQHIGHAKSHERKIANKGNHRGNGGGRMIRPKFRAKLEHNLLRQLLLGVLGISSY